MPHPTISDTALVDALGAVFSRHGYEGASLNRMSEATGLKRSSLYHRFPNGKDEIIEAVAARAAERFEAMLAPAFAEGDPADRAREIASAIRDYYGDGANSCLIVSLSAGHDTHRSTAAGCVGAWSDALKNIALDAGFADTEAMDAALDVIASIEGSLVISATSGNLRPFDRALNSLPQRLTEPG